jgi:NAD(P)H-nitrite reductase large subunit
MNAITTIREIDRGASEIVLVSAERPYSRMVLPYYLARDITEPHVFTANPSRLAQLNVTPHLGRRAARLDTKTQQLTLDNGTVIDYDDLLIATGSSAVRAPVLGAEGVGIHSFWTLEQARAVLTGISTGTRVVMVGAGFIAFTILNSLLKLGVNLSIIEIAPQILPRMIDRTGAEIVEGWLKRHGVEVRTGVQLQAIDDVGGHKRLRFQDSSELEADLVIMATGIRTNLDWLASSGVEVNRGVLVDDHLRSNIPNVYAAGDVAEGRDCVTGERAIHAIEPTAMEHGRIVGANMAGQALAYRGSLLMNIVDVADLEIASFGVWDSASAEVSSALKPDRPAYRKLLWQGDRLIGAIILGVSTDIWTTNDVGMLKGLVQSGSGLGPWKEYLRHNPFDIKKAFLASHTMAQLLPQKILARPSIPAGRVSA